jgi:hypothetical protein
MTYHELMERFDWSRTKPDMVDRVARAVESQFATLVACCGPVKPCTVITWCDIDPHYPLSANNISFRNGLGDVDEYESVLAVPRNTQGA